MQTEFPFKLTKRVLLKEAEGSNVVVSPLSIQVVLGMIAAGSKGPTQNQLLSFLNSKTVDEVNSLSSELVKAVLSDGSVAGGPRLSFANGVWIDESTEVKRSFKMVMDGFYKATVEKVDFQTKHVEASYKVNKWVEKQTNGLIKEILPSGSIDNTTRLILTNALYFKGAWANKFDASMTKQQDFYLLNGTSVQAPFMTTSTKQFIRAFDSFKVLNLPYQGGGDDVTDRNFSMLIFLPNAKNGLHDLVTRVCEPGFLDRHIPYSKVEVGKFLIPKFKIGFEIEASEVLQRLGLVLPFSDNNQDLTEMVESVNNLSVSHVFHKAFVEVNEEGTEAAAATAAVMVLMSRQIFEKLDFVADHPFVFVVRENVSKAVLFIGQVLNPLANDGGSGNRDTDEDNPPRRSKGCVLL